jgi:hypothetical protein
LLSLGGDGEAFGKSNLGPVVETVLSFLDRSEGSSFNRGKKARKLLRLSFSADLPEEAAEATGQDFPVPQHGVGKEGAEFSNAFAQGHSEYSLMAGTDYPKLMS